MENTIGIRDYYDKFAENYDNVYYSIQFEKYHRSLSSKYVNAPLLYDFGGGSGLVTTMGIISLLNFDCSIEMLRYGIKHRVFQGIASDMTKLPIRSRSVDYFISYSAIQNTSSPQQSWKEFERVSSWKVSGIVTFLKKSKYTRSLLDFLENHPNNYLIDFQNNPTEDHIVFIYSTSSSSGSKSS